jgi:SARP family transcriptional regulator, regulator of embCAB operon
MPDLSVRLLGPIQALHDAVPVYLGPARQREVLAVLALRAGTTLSTTQLVDALWAHPRPASADNMVHCYVGRLRRVLGPLGRRDCADAGAVGAVGAAVHSTRPGYLLDVPPDAVDVGLFHRDLRRARAARTHGDLGTAVRLLRQTLRRCHAPFLREAVGPLAEAERTRLDELRRDVVEELVGLRLLLGDDQDLVSDLRGMLVRQPLRERLWALLLVALGQSSRRAEALTAYQDARVTLIERLGVEPGREVQDLYLRLLRNEPVAVQPWWDPSTADA